MAVRLLWPVPVGMADNHDAERLMCQVGADAADGSLFRWANKFLVLRYPATPSGRHCAHYLTSEALPLSVLSWIHVHVLGLSGAIDMREAIVAYCLLTGVVIAVGVRVLLKRSRLAAAVFAVALFLILADATFADYAASPYSETAALNGLLVFGVAGVLAMSHARRRRAALLVAWAAALFAVAAKTETAPLAVVLAGFFLTQRLAIPRLARFRFHDRVVPVFCALTLLVAARVLMAGGLTSIHPPDEFTNVANEITMTVMPQSDDPAGVAQGLGLPRSFGAYSGSDVWKPHPIEEDPAFPAVADKFTMANLGRYLAGQPALSARILASGSHAYLSFRNEYLGTDPIGSGYSGTHQECRECLVTGVSHLFEPVGFTGIVVYWLVCAGGAVWLLRRTPAGSVGRGFGTVSLTLTGCAVIEYFTSVFGEGNEVTKHLAPALFAATLAPLWVVVGVLVQRRGAAEPFRSSIPAARREEDTRALVADALSEAVPSG